MTKRERELTERIERPTRAEAMSAAEYTRYHNALNGLMREIATFIGDQLNNPTSINSGRLIAALEQASRTIHY